MNQELIVLQLNEWMMSFVEQPNPSLGSWAPCPYARQARINGRTSIKFSTISELRDVVKESIETLEHKDVVVICFDHQYIDPVSLQEFVTGMNKMLIPIDYVILEDHPDAPEYINGVKMNFGRCGLLLMQRLSKLNEASEQLKQKGYYDSWSRENLDYVVNWRNDEILQN